MGREVKRTLRSAEPASRGRRMRSCRQRPSCSEELGTYLRYLYRRWSQLRLFVVHPESGEGVRMPKSHQTRRQCCGRWLSARALSFASELKDKNPITSIIRSFRIRSGLGPSGIESGRRNNRGILWGKRARPQVQAHRIVYGLGTVRLRYLKTAGRTSGAMLLIQRRQEGCTMGTYR